MKDIIQYVMNIVQDIAYDHQQTGLGGYLGAIMTDDFDFTYSFLLHQLFLLVSFIAILSTLLYYY
jgi:hypothetical protein